MYLVGGRLTSLTGRSSNVTVIELAVTPPSLVSTASVITQGRSGNNLGTLGGPSMPFAIIIAGVYTSYSKNVDIVFPNMTTKYRPSSPSPSRPHLQASNSPLTCAP